MFPGLHRRYAGIVLDVLFDYFLSLEWEKFSRLDRGEFIEGVYRVLTDQHDLLPPALAAVAPRWVAADWLRVYQSMEGVDAVLDRLSRRMSAPENLMSAWRAVRDNPRPLRDGFLCVFPGVRTALDGL
jgi:acyl carrier protein phosphodiesterase